MRLRPDHPRERTLPMDLTPMVDVVFLLIIFFLTTSSLIEITRADVDLPQEEGEDDDARRERGTVINITRNGTIIVSQQRLTQDELAVRLRAAARASDEPLDIVMRVDREADLQHVNRVAEMLSDLGVRSWRLATEVPR